MYLKPLLTAAALLFASGLSHPAIAQLTPEIVVADLVAALSARDGARVSHDGFSAEGETIVVRNLISVEGDNDKRSVTLPELTIVGAAPRDKGGFTARSVALPGGAIRDGDRAIEWASATASNVVVPSPDEVKAAAKIRPFDHVETTGLTVKRSSGETVIAADFLQADIGPITEDVATDLHVTIEGGHASLDLVGGVRRKALLQNLGYEDLPFALDMTSRVDLYKDIWDLNPLEIAIEGFGDLTIQGHFTGVSLGGFALAARRQSAREEAKLEEATFTFGNGGLVDRALDRQAGMMGVDRETFVANFLGAVPFMLNFIGNPPFQAKLAAVAGPFLNDPRSVTISAAPTEAVSFETVATTLRKDRGALPDLLSMEVSINE